MPQRIQWEDRYAMDIQSAIGTAVDATNGVDTQSGETKAGVLLNNHPHFETGPNIIDTEKSSGSASRLDGSGREFQQGTREPSFPMEFDAICKPLYLPLHLFTQRGSVNEFGTTTTKWFYPYSYELTTPGLAEIFGTFVRSLAPAGTAESHRAVGAVCNSISFNAEVNASLSVSAEFMAQDIETNRDITNDNFDLTNDAVLLWQDATTEIGNGSLAPVSFDCDGFSLTLTNNLGRKFYSNQLTQKYIMSKITGEGTIKIPWTPNAAAFDDNVLLANFVAGTPQRFSFYWGNQYPSANNNLSLNFIARYTGAPVGQDEDEIVTDLSFQIVERVFFDTWVDGNNNITSFAFSGVDDLVDTFVFAGSETIDGNVFPGDYAIFPDSTNPDTKILIDEVNAGVPDFHVSVEPITPGTAELVIISQPFNIGLNDNIVRADVS